MKKYILTLTFFLIYSLSAKSQPYENLVFEGAGIRGIAYCGVVKELEKRKITKDIVKVGGTSAGAITALMLAIGYSSSEMYDIISETKFQKFNDGQYLFVGGLSRMKSKYGWYKGDKFTKWLENIIKAKTGNADITFRELKEQNHKELYITATCMNKQKLIVFSEASYPYMKIKDAVRISMSIPLYFEAVFIDSLGTIYKKQNKKNSLDIVVDGGILGNFPIAIFDTLIKDNSEHIIRIPNSKTLGIRIDTDEQIRSDLENKTLVPYLIKNLSNYIEAFYTVVLENLNRNDLMPEDWARSISVSSVSIGPGLRN
ncbi:MAG: patatin-like phospholipase family protein [Chitinophagaceae bacterium]